MGLVPKKVFFTKGIGRHQEKLRSFELALRNAHIEKYNLVHVSSILPPNCEIISVEEGVKQLHPGEIVYCVMARNSSNEPYRKIAASIGLAVPKIGYGYLSEHYAYGQDEEEAGDYAEDLATAMLASTLGIDLDLDVAWDESTNVYTLSGGKIVHSRNTTSTAIVDKGGLWTSVIAAVFVL